MLVSFVVPTYNERENLPPLVNAIAEVFSKNGIGCKYEIIVMDDDSPDGTWEVAKSLAKEHPVQLVRRKKREGLGAAYRDGFRHAKGDVIFEMDADLSHDPKYIPDFLEAIEHADIVVGSRYMKGGGISDWTLRRRAISAGGNFLARLALGLKMHDITSGYKAYRKSAAGIVQETASDHYVFQAETLYLAKKKGLIVREIPIVFRDRKMGKSKLGNGDVNEFAGYLMRIWAGDRFGRLVPNGKGRKAGEK